MTMDDRPTVAHAVSTYLPATGTWIYSQLAHLRRYRSIVLTDRTENPGRFPFTPVYSYDRVSTLRKVLLCIGEGRRRGASESFFARVVRKENVRLIQSHFGYTGVAMLELKARARVAMVTTFYGADVSQIPRQGTWRDAYRRLFDEGDLFLAEGNAMRDSLIALGCPPAKALLQRIGIPLEAFPYRERRLDASGRVRVLVAAVFREKKGIPDALRAVERVRQHQPGVTVTLLGDSAGKPGDDEEKEKILALVARLGKGVEWLGFQPYQAYQKALQDHHIFLSPSLTAEDGDSEGGAPISLIEAQATGMPIVATSHADIPEIVVDGQTGLLSPERDVEALAANLDRLVTNPGLWSRMGRAARAHVESNHDIRTQMARLEDIYERVARAWGVVFACVASVAA